VTKPVHEFPYSLRHVQQLLGISRNAITQLIAAGFVSPARGARNEHRFNFQDLMLLRTAHALQDARIPPRKIVRSLQRLKARLPEELPLTGLRITAIGADVAVRNRAGQWEADTGQLLMDFEVASVSGSLAFLERCEAQAEPTGESAATWFARGVESEVDDGPSAEAAYRRALSIEPDFVDAYLNLGAMLCEAKRCDAAVEIYEQALLNCPDSALVHYNYAIALEDQGRWDEAVASYERSLELDPALADAHFNLGRILEQQGDARRALRHYSAYRRQLRG
jgi:tetratricopeptide (TPR) repeat protein